MFLQIPSVVVFYTSQSVNQTVQFEQFNSRGGGRFFRDLTSVKLQREKIRSIWERRKRIEVEELWCPRGLVLAAVAAASGTHRAIHASRNVVHVDVGAGQTAWRHRTRAGGEQRVAGRVRVSGLCIHRRNPHLLQWYTTSWLHESWRALTSTHCSCKFVS